MPCVKNVFFLPFFNKHHSALVAPLSAIKVTDILCFKVLLNYLIQADDRFKTAILQ